jgi:hypothetical protein
MICTSGYAEVDMQKWICRSGYAEVDMQKWICKTCGILYKSQSIPQAYI